MKYTPRHNFIVLQMDTPVEVAKQGFRLERSARDDHSPATVMAIGPGVPGGDKNALIKIDDLVVGDRVVFNKYSALELNEDERVYLIRDTELGCKVND